MKKILILLIVIMAIGIVGCSSDADVASYNLSQEAEKFNVYRRVVFYNGITDEYILQIEGYCSVDFYSNKFVVTVKKEDGTYLKHYLGKSDNVFPFVEQLDPSTVSDARYKVIFKPSVIVPDVEIR